MYILYHSLALLSEAIFPMTTKDRRINIVVGAYLYGFNFLYLYPGYMIISGQADQESQPERIAATLIMFIFGVFLTMTSNSQKYFILKAKEPENKKRDFLITEGMFGWTRNPNYLGTIITNFALCCLYREWDAWILYSLLLFMSMLPMMLKKEGRLRAKNGAEEYFKRSGFLFPKFTESCLLNFLIYLNILVLIFLLYLSGGAENTAKNIIHMIKHCGIDWEHVNTTVSPIVDQIFTATGFK
uniref:Steroid 5-alpha reductase C-terminal domain-containing protein n=1 Tax=Euplotes crassus TaxID=5936 RepID=A0A7S3NX23_EUPCR|mmetsp:Transcript_26182/g.26062  ORF Transcript_26182/g.26062 Transcript_26182/m.26062 type:complete len:242 (+) Transcript_26182:293-1018(+)